MPFHTRLLGKDRLALYLFIHSLNTNFGTSVFELAAAQTDKDSTFYARLCSSLDAQIDALVYDLYDLSEDERTIIKSS